jgi:hypothetical protein
MYSSTHLGKIISSIFKIGGNKLGFVPVPPTVARTIHPRVRRLCGYRCSSCMLAGYIRPSPRNACTKGEIRGRPVEVDSFLQQAVCVCVVGVESGDQGWLGLLLAMQVRPMLGDSIFNVQVNAFRACGGPLITIHVLRQNVA